MSALGNTSQITQQLNQDLQNELLTANQLLRSISIEIQQLRHLTNPGEEFEANISKSTSLVKSLADLRQTKIENFPPFIRKPIDMRRHINQNVSREQHNTMRNDSEMEESQ